MSHLFINMQIDQDHDNNKATNYLHEVAFKFRTKIGKKDKTKEE